MTGFSVLTNPQAASAVLGLNKTLSSLNQTQERINTGLKVGSAKDDAATFSIALGMRSDVAGYKQIQENMNLGKSTVGVAASAADSISEEIKSIKTKVTQAANLEAGRDEIQLAIDNAMNNIRTFVGAAQFNGVNLIDGNSDTLGKTFDVVSSLNRSAGGELSLSKINVAYEDLSVDNTGRGLSALTEVDVSQGRVSSTSQSFADGTIRTAGIDMTSVADGDTIDLTYVDANGDEQTITFTGNDLDGGASTTFQFDMDLSNDDGTTASHLDNDLAAKINALAQDGGALAGLGIVASDDGAGNVAVTLEGPEAAGKIVGFASSNTTIDGTAATTEAQAGVAQIDLQVNDQLKAGDEIQLTLNDGGNNTTITLVVGEKDAANTSGAAISGTSNKFVLDYEDVVQDGTNAAKTADEVSQVIADVLIGSQTFSSATIDGATNTALDGASSTTFAANFDVQAVGDSVRVTDIALNADEGTNLDQLVSFDGNAVTGTALNFDQMLTKIDEAESHLKSVVARIGAAEQSLESQSAFMDNLVKSVNDGIGTLVDANMAEESAKFQALQVQQQLGLQALSIANSQPQSILSLFR